MADHDFESSEEAGGVAGAPGNWRIGEGKPPVECQRRERLGMEDEHDPYAEDIIIDQRSGLRWGGGWGWRARSR